jgi:GNAT superfamily N-acetyltransferase
VIKLKEHKGMAEGGEGEWRRSEYTISTDNGRLDLKVIHDFIANHSYWGQGRKIETVQRSLDHSLNFGVFKNEEQVGFARVVTDFATFAWVADVFILPDYRGLGLAKWLMESILAHPDLQGFRRWVLATKDAHELYRRFGFRELKRPERWMERPDPHLQEAPDYWKDEKENGR